MLFNSFHFLMFFPLVTLIYFLIPFKARWIWLLGTSYYFYMCWNPKYAILMATSTIITYLSGLLISKSKDKKKLWVALSFISNLGILFFFKYFDFAIENVNIILNKLHMQLITPSFDVLLPVGISFYTFQALSYTVDVYRGDVKPEKNLCKYALFVSFFPQLVAGPIETSKHLLDQFNHEYKFEYNRVKSGLLIMLWGFFQKLVIADRVAILVNTVFNDYKSYSGFTLLFASILFAVQIYCDFSSYSDIAIGSARVMGFDLMQNFKSPYFSKSIAEFWRRWHISLGGWFREYLYFPLGGSRKGKIKKYRNLMIVFLTSGLWHGAGWNFIIWGFLHGFYQIAGMELKPLRDKLVNKFNIKRGSLYHKIYQCTIVFILVDFAWIFFRANTFSDAVGIIKGMFVINPWVLFDGSLYTLGLDQKDFSIAIISILILIMVSLLRRNTNLISLVNKQCTVLRWSFYFTCLYTILIFGVYGPGYSAQQFIYFQF